MNMIKQAFMMGNSSPCIKGYYIPHDDSSLMYSEPIYGDFQLLLGEGYHMSLGINRETGACLTFYTLLDALAFEKTSLCLSDAVRATLFYQSDLLRMQEGGHYVPFLEKMYYDSEKMLLAFGNIKVGGMLIEFSENTYAMLHDERLDAIYLKVSLDVINRINRKNKKRNL